MNQGRERWLVPSRGIFAPRKWHCEKSEQPFPAPLTGVNRHFYYSQLLLLAMLSVLVLHPYAKPQLDFLCPFGISSPLDSTISNVLLFTRQLIYSCQLRAPEEHLVRKSILCNKIASL